MTGESTPETSTAVLRDPEPPDRLAPPAVAEAPRPGPPPRAFAIAGIVVVAIVAVCCLGLAFRSGAYSPADWLPFLIGIAALACVVAVSGPVVRAGRVQRVLLALFALLAVWTVLSIFWATSRGDTWEEINRTLFYAVTVALVFAAVRWAGPLGLRVLTGLLVTVIGITALVVIVRLRTSADPAYLFPGGRLNYPISYYNGVGCFLMIGFWLALGLANAPGIRPARRPWSAPSLDRVPADPAAAPTTDRAEAVTTDAARWLAEQAAHARAAEAATARAAAGGGAKSRKGAGGSSRGQVSLSGILLRVSQPVLLMLAVVLLEIAILPQSRGALWTFLLVIPFFVIFSPNRFRALVDLAIVAVPLVFSWGSLNGVYSAVHNSTPLAPAISTALQAVGYSVLFVLVAWAVTYVVERLLGPLSGRIPSLVGGILIVLAIGGAIAGLVWADIHTGGLGTYVGDRWSEFKGDSGPGSTPGTDSGNRFAAFGLNGRLTQWKVAYKAFEENPATGLGAQGFDGLRPVSFGFSPRLMTIMEQQHCARPQLSQGSFGDPRGVFLPIVSGCGPHHEVHPPLPKSGDQPEPS